MSIKGTKYVPKNPLQSAEAYLENFNVELLNELVSFEPDPACIYYFRIDSSIIFNSEYTEKFNVLPLGLSQLRLVSDNDATESVHTMVSKVAESKSPKRIIVEYEGASLESNTIYELTAKPVYQENQLLILIFREINNSLSPVNNGSAIQAIHTQSQNFKALLNSTTAGFIKTDLKGNIITVGAKTSYLLGHEFSYYLNKSVEDLLSIDSSTVIGKAEKKLINQKKGLYHCTASAIHSSGKTKYLSLSITLIGSQDLPEGFLFSCIDITNDFLNNEKLKSTKNKFKEFIENCPTGIVQLDFHGKLKYCSPSALEIFDLDKSKVKNQQLSELIHPSSIDLANKIIKEVKETGDYKSENIIRINNKENKLIYVEFKGKRLGQGQKNDESVLLMIQDLSDQIQSEIALIEQESLMYNILERTPMSIYALDRNCKVLFANTQAKKDFKSQHNIDIVIGSNLKRELPKADFTEKYQEHYQKVLAGRVITDIINHDTQDKIRHTQYYPLKNMDGGVYSCLGVSQDITAIKHNEFQLDERQAYLSAILDSSPDGICVFDLDRKIAVVNPKMNELFLPVYHKTIDIGENLKDIIPKVELTKLSPIIDEVFEGKSIQLISEYDVEGESKYFDFLYAPVRDNNGKIIGCIQVVRDFTDHQLKEKQILTSEKKYRDLVEFLPCGIAIIDDAGRVKYLSQKSKLLLGIDHNELLVSSRFSDFFEEDESYIRQALSDERDDEDIYKLLPLTAIHRKDNSVLELKTKEIEYENEQCRLVLLFDLTEKINSIKEKEERQKLYEALIENALDAIDIIELTVAEDGSYKSELKQRNRKMQQYFKKDEKAQDVTSILNNAPLYQANGQLTKEVLKADIAEFMRKGQLITERLVYDVNRNERHIQLSTQLLEVNDKKVIIRNYKDITDKKRKDIQIENNLREINNKNIELEKYIKSNYDLQNFAFIASHDLKAPLRTILSFSQLLKRSVYHDLSDKERVFIDIILRSSKSMEELIEDLLNYSDVNNSKLNVAEINTAEFMNDLLINISSDIEAARARINIKKIPEIIFGDKIKLGQLFQNLIRNGIKFHKANMLPEITIDYTDVGESWQFSISDNGIGIAKEYLSDIFKIFKTLNNKSDFKGHGIGLSICQQIVAKHDGNIWVDSIEGEGSTFTFTIKKPA